MNAPLPAEGPPSSADARGWSMMHIAATLVIGTLVFLGLSNVLGLWKALFTTQQAAVAGVAAAAVVAFSADLRSGLRGLIVTVLIGLGVGVVTSYLW